MRNFAFSIILLVVIIVSLIGELGAQYLRVEGPKDADLLYSEDLESWYESEPLERPLGEGRSEYFFEVGERGFVRSIESDDSLSASVVEALEVFGASPTRYEVDLVVSGEFDNFRSLDELPEGDLKEGDVAHVLGYSRIGDGGEGYYVRVGSNWLPMNEETLAAATVNLGGNFACIDPVHGNDVTARVGNYDRPFRTWASATYAARSSANQETERAHGPVMNRLLICAPGTIKTTNEWNGSIWAPRTRFIPAEDSESPSRATIALSSPAAEEPFVVAYQVEGHIPFALSPKRTRIEVSKVILTEDAQGQVPPTVFAGVGVAQGNEVSSFVQIDELSSSEEVLGLASDCYFARKIAPAGSGSVGRSFEGGRLQVSIGSVRNTLFRVGNTAANSEGPFHVIVNVSGGILNNREGWTGGVVGARFDENVGSVRLQMNVSGPIKSLTGGSLATTSKNNQLGVINVGRSGTVSVRSEMGIVSLDEGPAVSVGFANSGGATQRGWIYSPVIESEGIPLNVCRGSVLWVEGAYITSANKGLSYAIGNSHNGSSSPGRPSLFCHDCETDLQVGANPIFYGFVEEAPEEVPTRASSENGTPYLEPYKFFNN